MLETSKCYTKIGQATLIQEYFDKNKDKIVTAPYKYYGWEAVPISLDLIKQEPILAKINKYYPIKLAGFLKMVPYTCYKWHTDALRKVGLNMLLTPNIRCSTIFGEKLFHEQYDIIELKYEPNEVYCFNTAIEHTVINFEEPRWLFSVEFSPNVTYSDILDIINGSLV